MLAVHFSFVLLSSRTFSALSRFEKLSELADAHRQNSSCRCSSGDHHCCACDACGAHRFLLWLLCVLDSCRPVPACRRNKTVGLLANCASSNNGAITVRCSTRACHFGS